tara:strand:+ start:9851 stop:10126 length:276 start_codon:yes stop_codon:yes gene_type:complete
MEFKKEEVPTFLINFEKIKEKIRAFEGCSYLELYQDKNNSETFFTYSRWEDEDDLENYRTSDLFKNIWATTKPMFRSKAQAWSVDTLHSLK